MSEFPKNFRCKIVDDDIEIDQSGVTSSMVMQVIEIDELWNHGLIELSNRKKKQTHSQRMIGNQSKTNSQSETNSQKTKSYKINFDEQNYNYVVSSIPDHVAKNIYKESNIEFAMEKLYNFHRQSKMIGRQNDIEKQNYMTDVIKPEIEATFKFLHIYQKKKNDSRAKYEQTGK